MQHRSMRRNSSKMRDSKPSHIWCRIFSVLIQIWTEKVWDESLMIQTFDPMNWRYTLWSWLPILNSQPYGKMADSPRMTMRHLSTLWEISRPCSPNTFVSIVCIEIFRAMRSSQARRSRIWDRSRIYVCVLSENTLMTSQPERYERKEIIQKMRFLTCMNMRPQDDENIFFSILIPRIGRFSHFFDSVSRTTHGVRKTPYGSRGSTRTRAVSFHHSHRGYCWSLSTRILSKNVIHTRRRVHGESTLHIKIHLENTLLQAINPTLFSHVFLIIYSGLRSSHTVFISIFLRKYLANIHHTSQRNIW